mmetsp:Transcript_18829/g.42781  ORF Transcript_18829/g.42781 Transcript_18829/m.42781 type:complete len:420 (+) Transcript_18829:144-1403(+)
MLQRNDNLSGQRCGSLGDSVVERLHQCTRRAAVVCADPDSRPPRWAAPPRCFRPAAEAHPSRQNSGRPVSVVRPRGGNVCHCTIGAFSGPPWRRLGCTRSATPVCPTCPCGGSGGAAAGHPGREPPRLGGARACRRACPRAGLPRARPRPRRFHRARQDRRSRALRRVGGAGGLCAPRGGPPAAAPAESAAQGLLRGGLAQPGPDCALAPRGLGDAAPPLAALRSRPRPGHPASCCQRRSKSALGRPRPRRSVLFSVGCRAAASGELGLLRPREHPPERRPPLARRLTRAQLKVILKCAARNRGEGSTLDAPVFSGADAGHRSRAPGRGGAPGPQRCRVGKRQRGGGGRGASCRGGAASGLVPRRLEHWRRPRGVDAGRDGRGRVLRGRPPPRRRGLLGRSIRRWGGFQCGCGRHPVGG